MNIEIKSDGTGPGTEVIDSDGKPIKGITKLDWSIDGRGNMSTVSMEFEVTPLGAKHDLNIAETNLPELAKMFGYELVPDTKK